MITYRYTIVSEYAGEQGHLGGGDFRTHGTFETPEQAFAALERMRQEHDLDYRSAWVTVEELVE